MMMDLEWYAEHTDMLCEADKNRVSIEMEAQKSRALERRIVKIGFMDNKGKISLIKKWYPTAYRTITECYPGFIEAPDDYPPVIVSAVNNVINLQCGYDYRELELKIK